ncbi:ArgE/DapE family deacylase [Aerococcus urinae]
MSIDKKVELLQEIIQADTVNGKEKPSAESFAELFDQAGIETKLVDHDDERASLVAEWEGNKEGKILALTGHFDVVAADDVDEWSYEPFSAEIVDGYMYGRGTSDMKAGLLGLALALVELKEEDFELPGSIRFLGTAGEEIGMLGSKSLTEAGYTEDIDAILIAEPVNLGEINTSHKGSLNYQLTASGQAAHSSTPQEGINAIDLLRQAMDHIQEKMDQVTEDYESDVLGRTLHSFTVIEGGSQENSIPETAIVKANARTIPEFSNEKIIDLLEKIVEEINSKVDGELSLEVTQNSSPVNTPDDSQLVQACLKELGEETEVTSFNAVTDASNFTQVEKDFDMVIYGPGDLALAHSQDEHILVEDYVEFIDHVKAIIKNYFDN